MPELTQEQLRERKHGYYLKYYAKHREKLLAQKKAEYAANPEPIRRAVSEYYFRDHAKSLEKNRLRHLRRKDAWNASRRLKRIEAGDEVRAKQAALRKRRYAELRSGVIARLGSKCAHCGDSRIALLHIDHVNGGGRLDRAGLTPIQFLAKVLADQSGMYQLLCANCNWLKRDQDMAA